MTSESIKIAKPKPRRHFCGSITGSTKQKPETKDTKIVKFSENFAGAS
jgi:hypothetical protein